MVELPTFGIGCAFLSAGSITRHEHRLIEAVFDNGARYFDVAPQYGHGTAERVLGAALKGKRNDAKIATKVGIQRPRVGQFQLVARSMLKPLRGLIPARAIHTAPRVLNFDPTYISDSLNDSLTNLKTDRIDCFLLHMPKPSDVTDDVITVLTRAKDAGKILNIGVASSRADTQEILNKWRGIFDVQQHSWGCLDPKLTTSDTMRITHGAMARGFGSISEWFVANPKIANSMSVKCDADLKDPNVLARALIGASLVQNSQGCTLFASRSIKRACKNVQAALDPKIPDLGQRFLLGLAGFTPPSAPERG